MCSFSISSPLSSHPRTLVFAVFDSFALQTFRPSAVDFSGLPLPVHHGHVVAQLRQPRHCARAAHQDAGTRTHGRVPTPP